MSLYLTFETASLLGMKMFCSHFWRGQRMGRCWAFGRVCTRWICLQVIAEKMKIYSYIYVGNKSISTRCFLKAGPIPIA